jgi:uncharacterized membrane protein YgaE (UPF0421/DUF939 family)
MAQSQAPDLHESTVHLALVHAVGAACVAVFSYVTARLFPFALEAYWAPMAAVLTLYPRGSATKRAGLQQFFGSAVGSSIGWASASWWHNDSWFYGGAVFVAVSVCYVLRCADAARLSAVAVTIITLFPFGAPPGVRALHRFFEVTYGVACAIGYTAAFDGIVHLRHRRRSRTA